MFRDLDPKNWPTDSSISTHTLVRELFEGTREDETGQAEEFPIDDPALQAELPPLIRDADSSQHSALIDALRGKNIVIQGPPGTGKSQTITNLIAEAMVRGKAVLFVADKLAALQVVRDRMDECGLGPFCLELHSHKTKKGELLKDIARRIELTGSFDDPTELSRFIAVAKARKKRLAEYVVLIKTIVEPIQQTVFDILWARESAYQSLPFAHGLVSNVGPPPFLEYTPTILAEAKDWLALYVRNLSDIIAEYGATNRHPWCWVQRSLSFSDEPSLNTVLRELVGAIDKADALARDVSGLVNPAAAADAPQAILAPSTVPAPSYFPNITLLLTAHRVISRAVSSGLLVAFKPSEYVAPIKSEITAHLDVRKRIATAGPARSRVCS
jgi:AAA domain